MLKNSPRPASTRFWRDISPRFLPKFSKWCLPKAQSRMKTRQWGLWCNTAREISPRSFPFRSLKRSFIWANITFHTFSETSWASASTIISILCVFPRHAGFFRCRIWTLPKFPTLSASTAFPHSGEPSKSSRACLRESGEADNIWACLFEYIKSLSSRIGFLFAEYSYYE